jgi:hypothetical protein
VVTHQSLKILTIHFYLFINVTLSKHKALKSSRDKLFQKFTRYSGRKCFNDSLLKFDVITHALCAVEQSNVLCMQYTVSKKFYRLQLFSET